MTITRRSLLAVAVLLALVAACGGGGGGTGTPRPPVAGATAKAAVERAIGVSLESQPVPADARQRGVTALYSNSAQVPGGQVVQMFVLDSADKVRSTTERVASMSGDTGGLKVFTGNNVICIYGIRPGVGKDNSAAVESAIKGL